MNVLMTLRSRPLSGNSFSAMRTPAGTPTTDASSTEMPDTCRESAVIPMTSGFRLMIKPAALTKPSRI